MNMIFCILYASYAMTPVLRDLLENGLYTEEILFQAIDVSDAAALASLIEHHDLDVNAKLINDVRMPLKVYCVVKS